MSFEKAPVPSSEEAKIETERTLSDADLIREGASYANDEDNGPRLELEQNQINDIEKVKSKEDNEKLSKDVLEVVTQLHQGRYLDELKDTLRGNKEGKIVFAEEGEAERFEELSNDPDFRKKLSEMINLVFGVTVEK